MRMSRDHRLDSLIEEMRDMTAAVDDMAEAVNKLVNFFQIQRAFMKILFKST